MRDFDAERQLISMFEPGFEESHKVYADILDADRPEMPKHISHTPAFAYWGRVPRHATKS